MENASREFPSWLAFLRTRAFGIGALLFALALGIRLVGIQWGLPNPQRDQSLHPDEPIVLLYSFQVDPFRGKLDPGFYNYGTLYLSTLSVLSQIVSGYSASAMEFPRNATPRQIEAKNAENMGRFHLAGRILNAILGAATAWIVFAVLRRRTALVGAVIGALAVAVAPGFVVHSRFQTVDVPATFLLLLSLFWALALVPAPGEPPISDRLARRAALLAGVFAGLSAGTKYTGILALLALAVAVAPRPDRWRRLLEGTAAAVICFFVATPGALLNPQGFWRDFQYEMTHTSTGHGLVFAALPSGFLYHLANLFLAMGVLTVLGGLLGLGVATAKRHLWALALVAYALVYYVLIGRAEVLFLRYVLPLVPVLAIGLGWAVGQAHTASNRRWRLAVGGAFLAVAGLGGGGLVSTVALSQMMANPDPRDEAAAWLRANGTGRSLGVVSDPWFQTPPTYPTTALPRSVPFAQRDERRRAARNPEVIQWVPSNPDQRADFDPALLEQARPDLLVLSTFETDDLDRILRVGIDRAGPDPSIRVQAERYQRFMDRLRQDYRIVRAWGIHGPQVHDLMYIQPRITVWERKTP